MIGTTTAGRPVRSRRAAFPVMSVAITAATEQLAYVLMPEPHDVPRRQLRCPQPW